MDTNRKTAIITGALLILATAASLLGSSITGPILDAPDYLASVAANGNRMIAGALLAVIAALASAGIALSLYPVLKKNTPGAAIGAVGFRLMEGVFYIVGALCTLSVLPLSRQFANAADQGASYFQVLGHLLLTAADLAGFVFAVIAFCIGGGLYYYAFYRSRLVPRWLSIWGLVALLTLLSAVLLTLFDGEPYSVSGSMTFLAAPIALQEMVLAVWLIVKGFNPSAIILESAEFGANSIQAPALGSESRPV